MKRKQYSASFKAKVALEAIRGLKTTNELVAEFGVHTTQIGAWKKQALESLPEVFTANRDINAAINIATEAGRNVARGDGVIPGICRVPVCETKSSTL